VKDIEYVNEVLSFSDNSKVQKLEESFSKYIGCNYAGATNSGTLHYI